VVAGNRVKEFKRRDSSVVQGTNNSGAPVDVAKLNATTEETKLIAVSFDSDLFVNVNKRDNDVDDIKEATDA
jgi:hypothetical protein